MLRMAGILLTSCLTLLAAPQEPGQPSQLDEVVSNVRGQPLGSGTVDDLALPEDLLRRLSDRILRRSYEDHFRIVVDGGDASKVAPESGAATTGAPAAVESEPVRERGAFQTVMDVLAWIALGVLAILGFFAWRARTRRQP